MATISATCPSIGQQKGISHPLAVKSEIKSSQPPHTLLLPVVGESILSDLLNKSKPDSCGVSITLEHILPSLASLAPVKKLTFAQALSTPTSPTSSVLNTLPVFPNKEGNGEMLKSEAAGTPVVASHGPVPTERIFINIFEDVARAQIRKSRGAGGAVSIVPLGQVQLQKILIQILEVLYFCVSCVPYNAGFLVMCMSVSRDIYIYVCVYVCVCVCA